MDNAGYITLEEMRRIVMLMESEMLLPSEVSVTVNLSDTNGEAIGRIENHPEHGAKFIPAGWPNE